MSALPLNFLDTGGWYINIILPKYRNLNLTVNHSKRNLGGKVFQKDDVSTQKETKSFQQEKFKHIFLKTGRVPGKYVYTAFPPNKTFLSQSKILSWSKKIFFSVRWL